MRNPTELMQAILTDKMAQRIIDFVSPVYGNSYVGLWIYQAIGTVLGEVHTLCSDLLYETNPMTTTLLLDYWEDHYGLTKDPNLTTEQRRTRLITKIKSRGACTPAKLAAAVSAALGGVEVDITENVAQNTFLVNIRENVASFDEAIKVINRMKPAHLVYELRISIKSNPTAELKTAIALTHGEMFTVQEGPAPEATDGITVSHDGNGTVTLNIPKYTVTHDENGTVTLTGIPSVEYDENGTVTIGE